MKKNKKFNIYQIITDQIIESLEKKVVPWKKTWTTIMPQNLVSKYKYKGINIWLTLMKDFSSPYWLTFKQAQKINAKFKEGEAKKSTIIVYWTGMGFLQCKSCQISKKSNEKDNDSINLYLCSKCGKKLVPVEIPFLRYYRVYNAEQFSDILVPEIPQKNHKIEEAEQIVESYLEETGIKIKSHASKKPCYNFVKDSITVPPADLFNSAEEFYATLFHEMVHSTGNEKRLKRNLKGTVDDEYAFEELVAELGAAFLCCKTNILHKNIENTEAYCNGWAKILKKEPKWIIKASSLAQKAVEYILSMRKEKSEMSVELNEKVNTEKVLV